MSLNGYDISAYQGALDINAVPADFVIIKSTGGDGYVNPNWRAQLAAAKAAGRLAGIYHFARDGFTAATAHSEAQWFIRNCADVLDGTVVVYLDWEGDNVGNVAYAKAWLDEVTAGTGVKPLIYASYATVTAYDWSSVANANYGLWESAYVLGYQKIQGYNPPSGRAPIPYWNTVAEWQYTSAGHLPGWPNDLDLDIFYGDATTWAAYAAMNGTITPQAATVTPMEEDIVATIDDLKNVLRDEDILANLAAHVWSGNGSWISNRRLGHNEYAETILGSLEDRILTELLPAALKDPAVLDAIASAVLNKEIPWHGFDGNVPTTGRTTTNLGTTISYSDANFVGLQNLVKAIQGTDPQVIAKAIVSLLPSPSSVDGKAVALELIKILNAGSSAA